MIKTFLATLAIGLSISCAGAVDEPIVGTEQDEMIYQCGGGHGGDPGGACYCCFDVDDATGCCICPTIGAWCRP